MRRRSVILRGKDTAARRRQLAEALLELDGQAGVAHRQRPLTCHRRQELLVGGGQVGLAFGSTLDESDGLATVSQGDDQVRRRSVVQTHADGGDGFAVPAVGAGQGHSDPSQAEAVDDGLR